MGLRMPPGTESGQIRKCATKCCAASSVCSGTLNVFFVFSSNVKYICTVNATGCTVFN